MALSENSPANAGDIKILDLSARLEDPEEGNWQSDSVLP